MTTWRIELERLRTVTPWRRTSSGSRASAAWTRLLTSMVAWSGSVPIWKVTDTDTVPLLDAVERM